MVGTFTLRLRGLLPAVIRIVSRLRCLHRLGGDDDRNRRCIVAAPLGIQRDFSYQSNIPIHRIADTAAIRLSIPARKAIVGACELIWFGLDDIAAMSILVRHFTFPAVGVVFENSRLSDPLGVDDIRLVLHRNKHPARRLYRTCLIHVPTAEAIAERCFLVRGLTKGQFVVVQQPDSIFLFRIGHNMEVRVVQIVDEVCKYGISAIYGGQHHIFPVDRHKLTGIIQ